MLDFSKLSISAYNLSLLRGIILALYFFWKALDRPDQEQTTRLTLAHYDAAGKESTAIFLTAAALPLPVLDLPYFTRSSHAGHCISGKSPSTHTAAL